MLDALQNPKTKCPRSRGLDSEARKDKHTRCVCGHENAKWVVWKAGACRMQIRKGALRAGWVPMASGFPKRKAPDL